jgi:hypothetical protein
MLKAIIQVDLLKAHPNDKIRQPVRKNCGQTIVSNNSSLGAGKMKGHRFSS